MKSRRMALLAAGALATALGAAPAMATPSFDAVRFDQRLGVQVPLTAQFTDDRGRHDELSGWLQGKPVILVLGYFTCPALCSLERRNLFYALQHSAMVAGRDYDLLAVSISSTDTAADAAKSKQSDMARFPLPGASRDWHYLIGDSHAVAAIAAAVGDHYQFDEQLQQYIHPTGVVVLSPSGRVSGYLLGVGYQPQDMQLAITRAERGAVHAALPVLLLCYHFDASTGRYSLSILKLLRFLAVGTLLVLGSTLYLALRRERSAR